TLLDAIDKGKVPLTELSLDQKQGLTTHPSRGIADRAKKLMARGGGLPNPDRQKVVEEMLPLTQKPGAPAAGEVAFQDQFGKRHRRRAGGAKLGPARTGMAVDPRGELLIAILDPSRDVEGNYRQYSVTGKNGRVLMGLLASESKTAVELVDAEARRQTILRED